MKHTLTLPITLLLAPLVVATGSAQEPAYKGDVTDVRVVRRVGQHPGAGQVWQPFIIQGQKKRQLIVAFGVMTTGKRDMGDILASLSKDDGDTWEWWCASESQRTHWTRDDTIMQTFLKE